MTEFIRQPHFAFPGEQIYCPNGHKIDHDVWAINEEPMVVKRCGFKWPPGNAGACDICVYWILLPGGYRVVKEVSSGEAYQMEQERMGVKEVMMFLGLRWARPANVNIPPRPAQQSAGAAR